MPDNSDFCLFDNIFTPQKIGDAKEFFGNMNVEYFAFPFESTVNLFAVIQNSSFNLVPELIREKLMSQDSTCRDGNLLGFFQVIDDDNITLQTQFSIALPLYFSNDSIVADRYFTENFDRIFAQQIQIFYNETCEDISNFLLTYLRTASGFIKQQVIFVSDQDPLCFQLPYPWNLTQVKNK